MPSIGKLRFRPVLNLPSYNIDYTFFIRIFIRPCFEFAHCQLGELGEIKTRANKTRSTVFIYLWKLMSETVRTHLREKRSLTNEGERTTMWMYLETMDTSVYQSAFNSLIIGLWIAMLYHGFNKLLQYDLQMHS